jgi:hypothetical protein
VVHINKIVIRSTPSQIDFIEQQKLGRVKEAAPILWNTDHLVLWTKARMECLFRKRQWLTETKRQTRFQKITGWLKDAIHDMHMDIIG